MNNIAYFDTCPECDSMNLRITDELGEGRILVICYECGADWEDIQELE